MLESQSTLAQSTCSPPSPPLCEELIDCAETLLTFVSPDRLIQRASVAGSERPARKTLRNPRNSGERKECPSQLSSKRQLTRVLPPVHITCDTHNSHAAVLRAYPSGDAARPPPPPRTTACRQDARETAPRSGALENFGPLCGVLINIRTSEIL